MIEESFNEKCDKVLLYLLDIYKKEAGGVHQLTHLTKVESDIGISPHDAVISFLVYEMKFIYLDTKTAHIVITPKGISFISHSSFVKEQLIKETKISLDWYDREDAKQRFDDYPTVKRQRDVAYGLAILGAVLTIISVIIALAQCR